MITIARDDCPTCLINAPTTGDSYSNAVVRDKLWNMQNAKCCYCEKHIPQVGHGAGIDHFRPKETPEFAHLRNSWANLLLACSDCNGNKGTQFPKQDGRPLLIDPASKRLNPEDHITFVMGEHGYEIPGLIMVRNRSPRGRKTIEVIRLWEPDYQRARCKYFMTMLGPAAEKLANAIDTGDTSQISEAKSEFEALLADTAEFAGFSRALARNRRLEEHGVSIPARHPPTSPNQSGRRTR